MAERSFAPEFQSLRLAAGEVFEGEAILAVTKALLQAGVSMSGLSGRVGLAFDATNKGRRSSSSPRRLPEDI
jgi:hypothetical protein